MCWTLHICKEHTGLNVGVAPSVLSSVFNVQDFQADFCWIRGVTCWHTHSQPSQLATKAVFVHDQTPEKSAAYIWCPSSIVRVVFSSSAPFALSGPWWVFQRQNKSSVTDDVRSLFFEPCGQAPRIYTNMFLCEWDLQNEPSCKAEPFHSVRFTLALSQLRVCPGGNVKTFSLINLIIVTISDRPTLVIPFPYASLSGKVAGIPAIRLFSRHAWLS